MNHHMNLTRKLATVAAIGVAAMLSACTPAQIMHALPECKVIASHADNGPRAILTGADYARPVWTLTDGSKAYASAEDATVWNLRKCAELNK